ncbi:hypothetical protein MGWOODY_XGa1571 [hydrothermal vent metagenome]|uniref:Uncharacterized protein n=1 Tax=hydrothermal vent metagenome TaxID=652676 RepID=A0A160TXQ0_9ZZZZ
MVVMVTHGFPLLEHCNCERDYRKIHILSQASARRWLVESERSS